MVASHWLIFWVSHWLGLLLGNKEVAPPPAGVVMWLGSCFGRPRQFLSVVPCLVTQSCPTLCDSKDCSPPVSSVCGVLQEWVAMPSSRGILPTQGKTPRSPALQADSFLSEAPGKPKNTGVGSLSLLQGIFPTQESNWVSYIAGRFFTSCLPIGIF